ncbi:unnamed protein product, partial [Vitis vinifera]
MGKFSVQQRLHQQNEDEVVSRFFCRTCSVGIVRIRQEFDLKCVVVLLLTLSVFVCALFWALPLRSVKTEFDAKDSIKLGVLEQWIWRGLAWLELNEESNSILLWTLIVIKRAFIN